MHSCSPPGIPHWDPGIHSAQVRSGWAEGCARNPHLAGPALPTRQLSVLRLTCLLPDCQLSHWDLSGHLPPGSLLRKWEGVEEVLHRGGAGAPGLQGQEKGTQEEGQVDCRVELCRGDTALLPRGHR